MRQKRIANSKQGPFRVAIWHACEPAVETPESVYIHLGRDSAFVSSLKRPAIVWRWSIQNGQTWAQKNVPMWYGIVDTVLYIGRMSILVSQGAVARAYCCLLKGLGLSSLGRSLDSYCWIPAGTTSPLVMWKIDLRQWRKSFLFLDSLSWPLALIHVVEIRRGTATKLLNPKVRDRFPRIAKFLFCCSVSSFGCHILLRVLRRGCKITSKYLQFIKKWKKIIFAFVNIC